MDIKTQIVENAERIFDHHGFAASGMDQIIRAAGVSSRTLYKHVGSKTALIVAVLDQRARRFFERARADDVDELFAALETWTLDEGARGCLFLRAQAETGGHVPEITHAVMAYRTRLRQLIERTVTERTGGDPDDERVEQILVLVEGAISASTYRGVQAISTARNVAVFLLNHK